MKINKSSLKFFPFMKDRRCCICQNGTNKFVCSEECMNKALERDEQAKAEKSRKEAIEFWEMMDRDCVAKAGFMKMFGCDEDEYQRRRAKYLGAA